MRNFVARIDDVLWIYVCVGEDGRGRTTRATKRVAVKNGTT